MANETKKTASERYTEIRSDIAAIMDWIGQELDAHAERAKAEPKNWGYTGDIAGVKAKLRETLASISGIDEKIIDETLLDMNA